MSKRVRSPVAAAPSRSWSCRTCLRVVNICHRVPPEHIRAHLLNVMRSVLGGCSAMVILECCEDFEEGEHGNVSQYFVVVFEDGNVTDPI